VDEHPPRPHDLRLAPEPRGKIEARDKTLFKAIEEIRRRTTRPPPSPCSSSSRAPATAFARACCSARCCSRARSGSPPRRTSRRPATFHREAIEPIIRLAELARRAGDVAAEKQRLREGLALDGMSFDPAARLTMLAVVTDDAPALNLGLARAVAVAPLHPLTLAAQALQAARAGDKARAAALSKRALAGLDDAEGRGPADTLVVLALASRGRRRAHHREDPRDPRRRREGPPRARQAGHDPHHRWLGPAKTIYFPSFKLEIT
jgi:predicted DNA-binding protein